MSIDHEPAPTSYLEHAAHGETGMLPFSRRQRVWAAISAAWARANDPRRGRCHKCGVDVSVPAGRAPLYCSDDCAEAHAW